VRFGNLISTSTVGTDFQGAQLLVNPVPKRGTGFMTQNVTVMEASRFIPTHPVALRRILKQFGFMERREDGQRILPEDLVLFFREMKRISGYSYPRSCKTRADLLDAVAKFREAADIKPEPGIAPEPASLKPENTNQELVAA
jgi:hypothetical protein